MLFWIKKWVTLWLMPLPFCLALILLGAWLTQFPRRARLGRILALGAAGILILLGNYFVARALLRPLEIRFPGIAEIKGPDEIPAELAACQFVVVLGAGYGYSENLSATNQLNAPALARITEGVRILRWLPDAKLIVSGGPLVGGVTHAAQLAHAAISLGVTPNRILAMDQTRDTEEEARTAVQLVQGRRIALVTSASHMPRAEALFRGAGLSVVPCPTGFRTQAEETFTVAQLFFDADALSRSTAALHERLGLAWSSLRGKTGNQKLKR